MKQIKMDERDNLGEKEERVREADERDKGEIRKERGREAYKDG